MPYRQMSLLLFWGGAISFVVGIGISILRACDHTYPTPIARDILYACDVIFIAGGVIAIAIGSCKEANKDNADNDSDMPAGCDEPESEN